MSETSQILALFESPIQLILLAGLGLLLFGKRLPEVAKSLGKSVIEFKKGLHGIEEDMDQAVNKSRQADMLPPPQKTETPTESRAEDKVKVDQKETVPPDNH